MYICPDDSKILRSAEVRSLREKYGQIFGKRAPAFNYVDFHDTSEKIAALVYKEVLIEAIKNNHPYDVKSRLIEFEEWLGR